MNAYNITADLKGHSGRKACTVSTQVQAADCLTAQAWAEKQLSRDLRFGRVKFLSVVLAA